MSPQKKAIVAAFLAGALLGGVFTFLGQRAAFHRFWRQGPKTERILRKLTRDLSLEGKQQEIVKRAVEAHQAKIMELRKETSAKFDALRVSMRSEIRLNLTPEQVVKFDAMAARWDARRKRQR